jgi:hypothetical protein
MLLQCLTLSGAMQMMRKELKSGGRVFIVYPVIEVSENVPDLRAAETEFENIADAFGEFQCGLVHGRLKVCRVQTNTPVHRLKLSSQRNFPVDISIWPEGIFLCSIKKILPWSLETMDCGSNLVVSHNCACEVTRKGCCNGGFQVWENPSFGFNYFDRGGN